LALNPLNWLLGLLSLDIGIDLGTANTLVHVKGKGIVINEPSWVAVEKKSRVPSKIGSEAAAMVGRVPDKYNVVRPLRDGVISEFEITEYMLAYFISRVHQQTISPLPKPRVVIGIPSGVTEVEKRAVYDAAMLAGARDVMLFAEPTLSALAAGLPIKELGASMVLDIGGGTSEVTVYSMGGIITSRSLRVAGDEMDQAILQYLRNKYNLLIGERMAERVKIEIGSAFPLTEELTTTVRGRNLVTGLPETLEISSVEVREAIASSIQTIIDTAKDALDEVPPETLSDLMDTGICLCGGGAMIRGLADRISEELHIKAWIAEDPMTCVARGAGIVLEDVDLYRDFMISVDGRH
jgi:rod shape-determining protein MreB